MSSVAVVTGGNKGIGYAIVRGLCKKFNGDVFLTARNQERGDEAVEKLKSEGLHPKFHQLDIDSQDSIDKFAVYIRENYGGLDLLVNNAGIAYKQASTAPFAEQASVTIETNFFGTLRMCDKFFPLLRSHARVVHVSSQVSTMALQKCTQNLRERLCNITNIQQVKEAMQEVIDLSQDDEKFKASGWPQTAYGASKVGITIMTPLQQSAINKDSSRNDILINSCCPGYVATDMSSHKGHLTIDEGAITPLYLATLPQGSEKPSGDFVVKCKIIDWKQHSSFI